MERRCQGASHCLPGRAKLGLSVAVARSEVSQAKPQPCLPALHLMMNGFLHWETECSGHGPPSLQPHCGQEKTAHFRANVLKLNLLEMEPAGVHPMKADRLLSPETHLYMLNGQVSATTVPFWLLQEGLLGGISRARVPGFS